MSVVSQRVVPDVQTAQPVPHAAGPSVVHWLALQQTCVPLAQQLEGTPHWNSPVGHAHACPWQTAVGPVPQQFCAQHDAPQNFDPPEQPWHAPPTQTSARLVQFAHVLPHAVSV